MLFLLISKTLSDVYSIAQSNFLPSPKSHELKNYFIANNLHYKIT